MKNKIEDLRNHLFAALEGLADPDKPMELDRARAIADVGRVLVDSAKAEVDFLKATGRSVGTGFIPALPTTPAARQIEGPPRPTIVTSTALRTCESCQQRTQQDPCEHCKAVWSRKAS